MAELRSGEMRMMLRTCALILALLISSPAKSQFHHDLLDPKVRDLLREEASGVLAKEHVIQITRHHRIQGSRDYRAAARYVLDQLRSYGFGEDDAYIESYPSDGKREYQTWQSPSGWDISTAELRMVEPYNELIVRYPEIAMSVMTYSNAGDVTADLVWVGGGERDEDYTGKNVAGKIVLATGYGGTVHRLAVLKYGAKAVVCYLDDERAKEHPDMLQYTGMWPKPDELNRVTFGFNITHSQGTKLRDLLLSGKRVVLKARVSGKGLEPFFMDVVVARIPGTNRSEQELVLSAHLDHPKESANDNASGSGAILDIARTLTTLIREGRLPRPGRTLVFMWVPEWNGTMAYLDAHPEMTGPALGGKYLANVNMDMVGENLELLHSQLVITRTPDSTPSVLNDVVENMAEMVSDMNLRTPLGSRSMMNYRIVPYGGGSDHMMFIDRKIPAVMFGHPDYTHHTSEDTPDKVDPLELERSEIIAAGTMWYLANLSQSQALDLAYLAGANAARRIGGAMREAEQMVAASHGSTIARAEALNLIMHASRRETDAIASVLTFDDSPGAREAVASETDLLYQESNALIHSLESHDATAGGIRGTMQRPDLSVDARVPVRLTRGPLDFGLPGEKLAPGEATWYHSADFTLDGDERFELVNFVDGKRSVSDIRDALSAEFGPVSIEMVSHYLNDLVKVGVMKWGEGMGK